MLARVRGNEFGAYKSGYGREECEKGARAALETIGGGDKDQDEEEHQKGEMSGKCAFGQRSGKWRSPRDEMLTLNVGPGKKRQAGYRGSLEAGSRQTRGATWVPGEVP
jgi:hypothetical protein